MYPNWKLENSSSELKESAFSNNFDKPVAEWFVQRKAVNSAV